MHISAIGGNPSFRHSTLIHAVETELIIYAFVRKDWTDDDIVVRKDAADLFCEERIAPYIVENFVQARHTSLSSEIITELPEGALFETKRMLVQVASQRVDALVAHVFKMSRGDAQALFPAGRIFVSGRLCESPGHTPRPGDMISVRGFGRFRYAGVESLSKKGKENTAVEVFV